MIFMPDSVALILSGAKTQTRRPAMVGSLMVRDQGAITAVYGPSPYRMAGKQAQGRIRWAVGRTYAVCPGRGKRAVARIRITGIRCERVCDITDEDARAEGIVGGGRYYGYGNGRRATILADSPHDAYQALWRSLYPKSDCTELCWVLTFEVVR